MGKKSSSILVSRQLERKCLTLLTPSDTVERNDGRTGILTEGKRGGQLRGQSPVQRLQKVPLFPQGGDGGAFLLRASTLTPGNLKQRGKCGGGFSSLHLLTPSSPGIGPSSQPRPLAFCCSIPWGAICPSHLSLGFSFEQIFSSQ